MAGRGHVGTFWGDGNDAYVVWSLKGGMLCRKLIKISFYYIANFI